MHCPEPVAATKPTSAIPAAAAASIHPAVDTAARSTSVAIIATVATASATVPTDTDSSWTATGVECHRCACTAAAAAANVGGAEPRRGPGHAASDSDGLTSASEGGTESATN